MLFTRLVSSHYYTLFAPERRTEKKKKKKKKKKTGKMSFERGCGFRRLENQMNKAEGK